MEGGFIDKDAFRRRVFQPLLETAELPPVTFHSLRHVSNSLLAANGVPLKVLQARLGHSTSRTTFDTYSHTYEDSQREATQALGRLFKGVSA
jgi:integrase